MTSTLTSKLHIDSWDEQPYSEVENGGKFTKAAVTLAGTGEGSGDRISAAAFDSVMYYRPDGTSEFVAIMRLTASLAGRSGSFALSGSGAFAHGTARMNLRVIEGSGTDELAGINGSLGSASTHDDYPFMPITLTYDVE